jgi:DNA-binding PadR family transcriptional regulator
MGRRFFRHGELHLVVLALLRRQPMHGYELMHELARLFGPQYRPSAGSIYPAVEALEAEGLVEAHEEGDRRVLELTVLGRDALDRRGEVLDALEVRTGVRIQDRSEIEAALARFGSRVRAVTDRLEGGALEVLLDGAAAEIEGHAARPAPSSRPDGGTAR